MPHNNESITNAVDQYWCDNERLRQGCHSLVRYIFSRQNRLLLTTALTSKVLDHEYSWDEIDKLLWSLTDPAIDLARPYYEFMDETTIEPVSVEEITESREQGNFVHPETGDLIDDFEPFIYLSFEAQGQG